MEGGEFGTSKNLWNQYFFDISPSGSVGRVLPPLPSPPSLLRYPSLRLGWEGGSMHQLMQRGRGAGFFFSDPNRTHP